MHTIELKARRKEDMSCELMKTRIKQTLLPGKYKTSKIQQII